MEGNCIGSVWQGRCGGFEVLIRQSQLLNWARETLGQVRAERWLTDRKIFVIVDLAEQNKHWRHEFAGPGCIYSILAFERDRSCIFHVGWK